MIPMLVLVLMLILICPFIRTQTGGGEICQSNFTRPAGEFKKDEFRSDSYSLTKEQRKSVSKVPLTLITEPKRNHREQPAEYPRAEPQLVELSYYRDPKDMTRSEIEKFKYKSKFHNMTVTDYTNWLLLFKEHPEQLATFHRANLRIVIRGGTLVKGDLPSTPRLPNKASHEYIEKTSSGGLDNITQPEFLGYQPSNFDDTIEGMKLPNRSLRHLDFVNPDEPYKTWILTREGRKISKND